MEARLTKVMARRSALVADFLLDRSAAGPPALPLSVEKTPSSAYVSPALAIRLLTESEGALKLYCLSVSYAFSIQFSMRFTFGLTTLKGTITMPAQAQTGARHLMRLPIGSLNRNPFGFYIGHSSVRVPVWVHISSFTASQADSIKKSLEECLGVTLFCRLQQMPIIIFCCNCIMRRHLVATTGLLETVRCLALCLVRFQFA